ncbi:MAG TPA: hypothetical protein VMT38_08180 [Terracidiphilus sp.]|nr:hypothetical protein [Terracidiphilus sp.]
MLRRVFCATVLIGLASLCAAQSTNSPQPSATAPAPEAATVPSAANPPAAANPAAPSSPTDATAPAPASSEPATPAAPPRKVYTVPAGTKVLLELRSAINTRSAKPGDGVYLSSTFPVVVGNRVMIPTGVYVQGVVDRVQRGGMHAKAQLDMHFTSIIFPNGTVAEIPGVVDSMPGAKDQKVKDNSEGTIEQNGDKGRNAGRVAEIALPSGAGVGTIGGAESGHPIEGGLAGLGAGLATVGIVSLFTRNADVDIPRGTQLEMILQRPLILQEENLASGSDPGPAPALEPASDQQKPITNHRPRVFCPPGSLGCE